MFNNKKNMDNLIERYNYLKTIEEEDKQKLEEINGIKKAFNRETSDVVCHVPLSGEFDFVKRNFENDIKDCKFLIKNHLNNIRVILNNESEFEKLSYLIDNKIELKIKMIKMNIDEINKASNLLETINNNINEVGNEYSSDEQLKIKDAISKINGLIERIECDKMASYESDELMEEESSIIRRNIERKKLEDKLKKKNINIEQNVENEGGPKL